MGRPNQATSPPRCQLVTTPASQCALWQAPARQETASFPRRLPWALIPYGLFPLTRKGEAPPSLRPWLGGGPYARTRRPNNLPPRSHARTLTSRRRLDPRLWNRKIAPQAIGLTPAASFWRARPLQPRESQRSRGARDPRGAQRLAPRIQGLPMGAALALKMRPPEAIDKHIEIIVALLPDGRLSVARFRAR
jgi:hypothetical protein